jgi:hypothetical protein
MRLRFIEPTESAAPGYPFRVGQIIETDQLTPEMQAWVDGGRAEIVREPGEELALAASETGAPVAAVKSSKRARG